MKEITTHSGSLHRLQQKCSLTECTKACTGGCSEPEQSTLNCCLAAVASGFVIFLVLLPPLSTVHRHQRAIIAVFDTIQQRAAICLPIGTGPASQSHVLTPRLSAKLVSACVQVVPQTSSTLTRQSAHLSRLQGERHTPRYGRSTADEAWQWGVAGSGGAARTCLRIRRNL